jgi:hypothetical protein
LVIVLSYGFGVPLISGNRKFPRDQQKSASALFLDTSEYNINHNNDTGCHPAADNNFQTKQLIHVLHDIDSDRNQTEQECGELDGAAVLGPMLFLRNRPAVRSWMLRPSGRSGGTVYAFDKNAPFPDAILPAAQNALRRDILFPVPA